MKFSLSNTLKCLLYQNDQFKYSTHSNCPNLHNKFILTIFNIKLLKNFYNLISKIIMQANIDPLTGGVIWENQDKKEEEL